MKCTFALIYLTALLANAAPTKPHKRGEITVTLHRREASSVYELGAPVKLHRRSDDLSSESDGGLSLSLSLDDLDSILGSGDDDGSSSSDGSVSVSGSSSSSLSLGNSLTRRLLGYSSDNSGKGSVGSSGTLVVDDMIDASGSVDGTSSYSSNSNRMVDGGTMTTGSMASTTMSGSYATASSSTSVSGTGSVNTGNTGNGITGSGSDSENGGLDLSLSVSDLLDGIFKH